MRKVKALLTFAPTDIGKPITYHLVKDFDLWINILHAEIAATKTGKLVLDIEGEEDNVDRAIQFLEQEKVSFQLINGSATWLEDKCVHCGACTSVCPSGALAMDKQDWSLVFNKEKCYVCQLCVKACPLKAMSVSI
jgi:ferredoxin